MTGTATTGRQTGRLDFGGLVPFFDDYKIMATWRLSADGQYLLVVTVHDREDGSRTTMMRRPMPGEGLPECMLLVLSDYQREYAL